jgi:hypothetical protein
MKDNSPEIQNYEQTKKIHVKKTTSKKYYMKITENKRQKKSLK